MTGPRFESLAAELRERIALGDYAPSGALESEAELGRRYAVSRVTVRRALERLRDEGLVAARRGSGWYVLSGAAFGQALAIGTFQHARSAVSAAGLPLTRTVAGYGYRDAPPDVAHLLDVAPGSEALRVRAVRHAGKHPLDVVTEWVPLAYAAPVSRADAEDPGVWETLRRHGHTIEVVRQSMTATAAGESLAPLLDATPSTPVLLVRRLALLAGERPLAVAEHRYLGHRFRLEVEFRGGPATATEPPGVTVTDSPH
jgi:DNA-binding GntR family transcriptional regulator